jgi:peptidoglycan hydrolase-like protein with peptidoglycan-binding domain
MRQLLLSTALTFLSAGAGLADGAALILGNERYDDLDRVSRGDDVLEVGEGLVDLGFQVFALGDGEADNTARALADFSEAAAEADAVVIILTGHFVTDGARSWLLTTDARDPGLFSLGGTAVSIESLLRLLSAAPGRAVLMIGSFDDDASLDPWLSEGIGAIEIPQGVMVIRGEPRELANFAEDFLIEPGADIAAAARENSSLGLSGFAPLSWRISAGASENVVVRQPVQTQPQTPAPLPQPNLSDPKSIEDGLGLTLDARREIQRDLTILDYNTRGIDGIFGQGTRRAIANWQQVNGYPQTTYLSADQIQRLDAQASVRAAELEAEAERKRAEQARLDEAYWEETGARGTEVGLRAYLERYPDGIHSEQAQAALEEIALAKRQNVSVEERASWDAARAINTVASYQNYLTLYPNGAFASDARANITELKRSQTDASSIAAAAEAEQRLKLNPITARLVEARLKTLGFDPGVVDGRLDYSTRRALRRYQASRDLSVTGYLNEATLIRILADTGITINR